MEKLLEKVDESIEYKIILKSKINNPLFVYIVDVDSTFLYLEYPDKVPFSIALDDIHSIIPSSGGRK